MMRDVIAPELNRGHEKVIIPTSHYQAKPDLVCEVLL